MFQEDLLEPLSEDQLFSDNAPQLDHGLMLIGAIKQCIQASPFDREKIIDRMNLCLVDAGDSITKAQFNKWIAPSQDNRFPAEYLSALTWAVRSNYPYQVMLSPIALKVIDSRSDMYRQYGQSLIAMQETKRNQQQLLREIQKNGINL